MRWQTPDPIGFKESLNLYRYARNNPYRYYDPEGKFAFVLPLVYGTFGAAATVLSFVTAEMALGTLTGAALGWGAYKFYKLDSVETETEESIKEEEKKPKRRPGINTFPENPDDLLPELPRDKDGIIQPADNIKIRPEKHEFEDGDTYNPRHHDQHYHIETRRDPNGSWNRNNNIEIIKPQGYIPGMGTGFLPGEAFPGINL